MNCIATVVSADSFQNYIPMFVYSAKRAYPNADIKIFLTGKMNDYVKEYDKYVYENQFTNIKQKKSTCNSLRHLLPKEYFFEYKYLYTPDIDFIFCKHESLFDYYAHIMKKTKQPHAGARGPKRNKKRLPRKNFTGKYARVAGGTFAVKLPEWFNHTEKLREKYLEYITLNIPDEIDSIPPCTYREYDEVMLGRIIVKSGIKLPKIKNCFVNKKKANSLYRDIHLGDFKFKHRWTNKDKMNRILKKENLLDFLILEKQSEWKKITKNLPECKAKKNLTNLRKYVYNTIKR